LTRAAKISNLQLLISLWDLDAMTKRESGGGNGGWRIDYLFLCYQLLSGEKGKEECISRTQKTREQVRARGPLNTHTTRHQKQKELKVQRGQLEFQLHSMRESGQFADVMLREGNSNEIVASQKQVIGRMTGLKEKERMCLEPAMNSVIQFGGGVREDLKHIDDFMGKFGMIVTWEISFQDSEACGYRWCMPNETCSFSVTMIDKKGGKVTTEKGRKGLPLEVAVDDETLAVSFNFSLSLHSILNQTII